jgi:hypothetical protein
MTGPFRCCFCPCISCIVLMWAVLQTFQGYMMLRISDSKNQLAPQDWGSIPPKVMHLKIEAVYLRKLFTSRLRQCISESYAPQDWGSIPPKAMHLKIEAVYLRKLCTSRLRRYISESCAPQTWGSVSPKATHLLVEAVYLRKLCTSNLRQCIFESYAPSLSCSQQLSTSPYPEPGQSTPHKSSSLSKRWAILTCITWYSSTPTNDVAWFTAVSILHLGGEESGLETEITAVGDPPHWPCDTPVWP